MITWFRLRELSRNASISWSTLPLDTAFLPVFTQTSQHFHFYSVEIWVRNRTESKNEREQYFVKILTNFAHPLLPGLTLWTAKWLFSFMWRVIIDWHGALMANHGALYSELKGWEALERWDSSNFCVTSTWQRRSPSIVCWLYVTLFVPWAVFYLLSFFVFTSQNPWIGFDLAWLNMNLPNGPHTHTCDAQTCFYMIS